MCEERKKHFLERPVRPEEAKTHAAHVAREEQCFSSLAPYEARFNKDVCDFTESEFDLYAIENLYASSYMARYHKITALKRYLNWCAEEGFISKSREYSHPVHHACEDPDSTKTAIRREFFASFEHFNEFVMSIVEWEEFISMKMDMAAFTLIFYGFTREEAASIKRSELEISEDKQTAWIRNRKIDNPDAVSYLEQVEEQSEFYGYFKIGSHHYDLLSFCDNEYLLRNNTTNHKNSDPDSAMTTQVFTKMSSRMNRHINRSVERGEKKFSTNQLWKSGRFCELYEIEKEYGISEVYSKCCRIFGKSDSPSERARLVKTYKAWREAFYNDTE